MWGFIEIPSPLAKKKVLQKSLRNLLRIPAQNDPQVKGAVQIVREALAWWMAMPAAKRKKLGWED